jgi:hypothetical protein
MHNHEELIAKLIAFSEAGQSHNPDRVTFAIGL